MFILWIDLAIIIAKCMVHTIIAVIICYKICKTKQIKFLIIISNSFILLDILLACSSIHAGDNQNMAVCNMTKKAGGAKHN